MKSFILWIAAMALAVPVLHPVSLRAQTKEEKAASQPAAAKAEAFKPQQ